MDQKYIQNALEFYKSHHTKAVDVGDNGTLKIDSSEAHYQELYVTHNLNINKVMLINYIQLQSQSIDMSAELTIDQVDKLISMLEHHKKKIKVQK